jgi:hypothetical protein
MAATGGLPDRIPDCAMDPSWDSGAAEGIDLGLVQSRGRYGYRRPAYVVALALSASAAGR